MTKEEIEHLARLARVALTPEEVVSYQTQLSSILEYVSVVNSITAAGGEDAPQVGEHFNVLRTDVVTNEPEQYTEALLEAMPEREGRFMKVKKILQQDE